MKKSRFSDSQIIAVLKQAEGGSPVPELCREHGIPCVYATGPLVEPLCSESVPLLRKTAATRHVTVGDTQREFPLADVSSVSKISVAGSNQGLPIIQDPPTYDPDSHGDRMNPLLGSASATDAAWTDTGCAVPCNQELPIYCIEG